MLIFLTAMVMVLSLAASLQINQILAETGKGEDVFNVTITIFGIDKSKGDLVIIVSTNNGEASKVKFLDSEGSDIIPINSSAGGGNLIEYVATFPNVTVNTGVEYKACVLTTKDVNPICSTGQNSPASRPEFVDISLNETTDTQQ
jgi:hypothetical protein